MGNTRTSETIVGLFVLAASVGFFLHVYNKTKYQDYDGYTICAKFDNADGIELGSDVKISGVKVGNVTSITIDYENLMANVYLTIDKKIKLTTDSEAIVSSSGILGGKYISLSNGVDETQLNDNDIITRTRGGQSLESLINHFVMSDNKTES